MDRTQRSRSPRANTGGVVAMGTEEINRLVVEREKARQAKDFGLSDALRTQLSAGGVTLHDKQNMWRAADGRQGQIPSWAQVEQLDAGISTSVAPTSALDRTTPPTPADDPELAQIKQMVQQREKARAAKDFAQSDSIRDQLNAMDVQLLDKEKLWRSKSGAYSGVILGYSGQVTDLEVTTLVTQREKARSENDYAAADMIRQELKAVGVDIHDKHKMWVTNDGRKGPIPGWQGLQQAPPGRPQPPPMMQHFGVLALPDGMQIRIEEPMLSRVMAMLQQGYGHAQQSYGHAQQSRAPRQHPRPPPPPVAANAYGSYGARAPMTRQQAPAPQAVREAMDFISSSGRQGQQISDTDIQWLIETREASRKARDFSSADLLRDAMRTQLGLELHEKEKRWVSSDGRQGEIPIWDSVA